MMISHEQARAAAFELRSGVTSAPVMPPADVSAEVLAAAMAVVQETPDTSPERLADAQSLLAGESPDCHAVASMMIQRIISDSLR